MLRVILRIALVFVGYILLLTAVLALGAPPAMPRVVGMVLFLGVVFVLPSLAYFLVINRSCPTTPIIKILFAAIGLGLLTGFGLFCWIGFVRFVL